MFGLKARDTAKSAVHQTTAKTEQRKPLQDLDVNRSRYHKLPSKDGAIGEKGLFASGFKVYGDGETCSRKTATASADTKKMTGQKSALQTSHGVSKDKSLPMSAMAQVTSDESLVEQLAKIRIQKVPKNKEKCSDEDIAKQDAPTPHPEDAKSAPLWDITKTQEPKPANTEETIGTGAIRKSSIYEPRTAQDSVVRELKSFPLNALAAEWKASSAAVEPNTNTIATADRPGSDKSPEGTQPIPTFWDLFADVCPDVPTTGRKIVGRRQYSPVKPNHSRASTSSSSHSSTSILGELDDRSGEILRYQRYKEARRRKAIEAMRVEQERQKRMLDAPAIPQPKGLYPNSPIGVKDQRQMSPPTVAIAAETYSAKNGPGANGYQRNGMYNQVAAPLRETNTIATGPIERSSICIYKYPTPPNFPIRYEPAEILKMNYQQKHTGKGILKNQVKSRK
ncbi:uncharacterized protein LOC133393874 [Anopheles gambiae]|uniref:uncharacterized protein LOC133393874 n=1 Tax=Anopheles gambiae TaxID=7165 RepID=UPI002AC9C21A|nr:uncharacterized protein LOC133393874 [Anopheles gambiae]